MKNKFRFKELILLISLILVFDLNCFCQSKWTLQDVEAAYKNKNFIELGDHLLDVGASARNELWVNAFKDTIDFQISELNPKDNFLVNLDALNILKSYGSNELIDYDFVLKVARFVRLNVQQQSLALYWFRLADSKAPGALKKLCSNEDLKLATIYGLSTDYSKEESENAALFAEQCFEEFESAINDLVAEANDDSIKPLCKILYKKGKLQGEMLKLRCQS